MRRLGVDLSEARLQQELFALGIDATYSNLTQADKSLLRYIALLKQTSSSQGSALPVRGKSVKPLKISA